MVLVKNKTTVVSGCLFAIQTVDVSECDYFVTIVQWSVGNANAEGQMFEKKRGSCDSGVLSDRLSKVPVY